MRVLVVGSVPVSVREAADELEGAGHEVVRCHDDTGPAFPCAALLEGQRCPLEGDPVDVVLDVHDARTGAPSPYEDGAVCGVRQHVPLVVASDGASALRPWATSQVHADADVVRACEEAADAPLARHSELATKAARDAWAVVGADVDEVSATVHRRRGSLQVLVSHPPGCDERQASMVATRVVGALRAYDRTARGVDVGAI